MATAIQLSEIERLRERVRRLQGRTLEERLALDTHPALAGLVRLQAGGTYQVEGAGAASLALTLMAGPSAAGAWCGVVGWADLGAEAAAEAGVRLDRTVLVPDPGEHWLEATAALVDVASLVVVRPPERVTESVAAKLTARLRKREAALVALAPWPRAEVRLAVTDRRWSGAGVGEGHLRERRVTVAAQRGAAPPRRTDLWLPAADLLTRRAEPHASQQNEQINEWEREVG